MWPQLSKSRVLVRALKQINFSTTEKKKVRIYNFVVGLFRRHQIFRPAFMTGGPLIKTEGNFFPLDYTTISLFPFFMKPFY